MPEYALTSLARIAPDFWAWRSGVFECEPVRGITQVVGDYRPLTRTTHTLPFEELSPRDFERLCLWLVEREGYERAEHLGAAGSEQGRDVIAWCEGELWAFECKRVRSFGPRDAQNEVEKVLALPEDQRPAGLVFIVTCDVSANTRQRARERCAGKMECHFWAGTELDAKVKRHPDIVEEFFYAQAIVVAKSTISGVTQVAGDYYAAPPAPTLSTAPAPPTHFTGRQVELAALAQALTVGSTPQATVALQGMGGVGKTALVAQLAAQIESDFPGGVFWADLPANTGNPLPILAAWARLCGHDVSGLPDPKARAQAVRRVLTGLIAERGRLLMVLDDVRAGWLDEARILQSARPPGTPLLLTTRNAELALALGATVRRLDVLPLEQALELLTVLAGPVVEREPEIAHRLAERLGGLPLALELAGELAARYARKPGWSLASLCEQIEAHADEALRPGQRGLAATLSLSYEALDPEEQRLFRTLGVFALAPFVAEHVAAVIAAVTGQELTTEDIVKTEAGLDTLVALSLVYRDKEQGEESKRYVLHPLLRDYATALLEETDEGPVTRAAHTVYYLVYAEAHARPTAADYDALEVELPNILAAMDRAYQEEQWERVRRFAWALTIDGVRGFLPVRGYWGEMRVRLEQAIRAAEAEGHRVDATAFAGSLAALLYQTGNLEAARQEYQRVLTIFEELGEREAVAGIYHQLGVLAQDTGEYAEARRLYQRSMDIKEELGNRAGIASTLHQLGVLAQDTGEYAEARHLYQQSLDTAEELRDLPGTASTLGQLGNLAYLTGEYVEARRLYQQSLDVFEELQARREIAAVYHQLGLLAEATGEYAEAWHLYRQSLHVEEEVGDQAGIAQTLHQLGGLALVTKEYVEAWRLYRQSLGIKEELGDQAGIASTLHELGNLAYLTGDAGSVGESSQIRRRPARGRATLPAGHRPERGTGRRGRDEH
jgi:tetratricopeptide (TPR) repeat protein